MMISASQASRAYGAPSTPPLRHLRQVLHPDYAMLPHAELCELMDSMYGPDAAERYDEYLEGIFGSIGKAFSSAARDVGRFAAKAAPAIATVGGGVLQGAMAGSALGLPGIIAGAAAGGVGAGLSKYGSGAARSVGNVLSGVTSVAGQFSPAGRVGASLGGAVSSLAGGSGKRGAAGAAINALGGLVGGRAGSAAAGALGALASGRGVGGAAAGALGALAGGRGPGGAALGALGSLAGGRGGAGSALGALGALAGGGKGGSPIGALTSLFGGTSAAGQLQSLLQRPETQRALAAINLGPLGRPSIPTGSGRTPVPVTAITNLIGQLSNQAAAEAAAYAGDGESTLHYMTDQYGEFVGDPAVESDRGERVWELLNEAHAERVLEAVVHYAHAQAEYIERISAAEAAHAEAAVEAAEDAEDAEDADSFYGTEAEFYEAMAEASASPLYFDTAGESEYFQ